MELVQSFKEMGISPQPIDILCDTMDRSTISSVPKIDILCDITTISRPTSKVDILTDIKSVSTLTPSKYTNNQGEQVWYIEELLVPNPIQRHWNRKFDRLFSMYKSKPRNSITIYITAKVTPGGMGTHISLIKIPTLHINKEIEMNYIRTHTIYTSGKDSNTTKARTLAIGLLSTLSVIGDEETTAIIKKSRASGVLTDRTITIVVDDIPFKHNILSIDKGVDKRDPKNKGIWQEIHNLSSHMKLKPILDTQNKNIKKLYHQY